MAIVNYPIGKCPKCGRTHVQLMISNNPLDAGTICFDCIKTALKADNLQHADFFCRTYNLPFDPKIWMELYNQFKEDMFQQYTTYFYEESLNDQENNPNLYYTSTTYDLWSKANSEWEKTRTFMNLLNKIEPIKESYIERGRVKWGEQYNFGEIFKLDSMYVKTLKANNVTNPLQKEAIKTLCKLHIEMDEAIKLKDAKAMKDFASTYSAFAKEADLETMINESKTDDITTVAELYQYMEDRGFQFKFYDNFPRDEVDRTIKDLEDGNRRLILESTGLQSQLEDMIKHEMEKNEEAKMQEVSSQQSLNELLNFQPEDGEIETEEDDAVTDLDFSDEREERGNITVIKAGGES